MTSRRAFLQQCMGASSLLLPIPQGIGAVEERGYLDQSGWIMPDESHPHLATWMAFAPHASWAKKIGEPLQDALARIANAIVQYEPVNMLVSKKHLALAKKKCDPRIQFFIKEIDDLWLRDTGPVFVLNANDETAGVNFNFNGWGGKQSHAYDSQIAKFILKQKNLREFATPLVMEGGGIEVDGQGTAILTESCVLNANRNPGLTKNDCETQLKKYLGIRKVIWLPGIAGRDITDGHTDFYARFARPGLVVAGYEPDFSSYDHAVTKRHLEILQAATNADNQPLQVVVMAGPKTVRSEFDCKNFAAGYINFYVANGVVLVAEFGDVAADAAAKALLLELFPGRAVVQLNIDPIAAGGGGIHCTTQQQPLALAAKAATH